MGRDSTKRYVDEVLEVSGVKKKGTERIREISQMSDQETSHLLDDIARRVKNHYNRNLQSILEDLRGIKGQPRAYYFGRGLPIEPNHATLDWFIRKSALYYNKIVLTDRLTLSCAVTWGLKPAIIKEELLAGLVVHYFLWPWIAEGIIEMTPPIQAIGDLGTSISRYADEDFQDAEGWQVEALRDEDGKLEGEATLRSFANEVQKMCLPDIIEKSGLRTLALRVAARGSSLQIGEAFFGSWLAGSSPTTDLKKYWRLFGYWLSRRAESLIAQELGRDRWKSFVSEVKAGRAWLALDVRELCVLSKLSPEKIVQIRDSADYSFQSFRKDLGYAVDEIQGLKLDDEEAYREAAKQAWGKVRDSARDVKNDRDTIRNKIGLEAGVLPVAVILGLLPFDIARLASMLIGAPTALDIAKEYLELRKLKKSTGYFLVKLEE